MELYSVYSTPHIPYECREDTLNFFDEFAGWEGLVDEVEKILPNRELDDLKIALEQTAERYPTCQRSLYDFPLRATPTFIFGCIKILP